MTAARYTAVLFAFGLQRFVELLYSERNERLIHDRQPEAPQAGRAIWPAIATINLGLFTLPAVERWRRGRRPPRGFAALGWAMALAAVGLRLSVLATLREAWNVRAVVPADLRVIDRGPYRFIRHPNYLALGLEFLGLPLIGGAYVSAVALSTVNALLLRQRILEEEALLMAIPAYRTRMGHKPRFVPRLVSGR
ncbi:MAG TPA: isoprenylcysteine carboxylmethyltransferase family protein [Candidatus Dormibacteraeota bacterium]|nr:isoprenylcysteine carboxylmethyltransferase family protein [Candidatus Dormibacteraeota bacterium]